MEVQIREVCENCNGTGKTIPRELREYWKNPSPEKYLEIYKKYNVDPVESDGIECKKCYGKRYIYKWVKIENLQNKKPGIGYVERG